jgi:CheY-like chemotaxis protein
VAATVLVVADEKEIRELLRRYLERAGYGVLTTGSGAEAVRLLGERGIDLTLLDLGLPDVDGDEVLSRTASTGCGLGELAEAESARLSPHLAEVDLTALAAPPWPNGRPSCAPPG